MAPPAIREVLRRLRRSRTQVGSGLEFYKALADDEASWDRTWVSAMLHSAPYAAFSANKSASSRVSHSTMLRKFSSYPTADSNAQLKRPGTRGLGAPRRSTGGGRNRPMLSSRMKAAWLALGLALTSSCVTPNYAQVPDASLWIHNQEETELGINTDYGILFLGRKIRAGEIAITAWFGDGPSIETTVVEPIGSGLYTAETEIRLPSAILTFVNPKAGAQVTLSGRKLDGSWLAQAEVVRDPRVAGILLKPLPQERTEAKVFQPRGGVRASSQTKHPDIPNISQAGAGVFVQRPDGQYRLLGVVSGQITLTDADGVSKQYITVLGPSETWRLAAHRRQIEDHRPRWVHREDVL